MPEFPCAANTPAPRVIIFILPQFSPFNIRCNVKKTRTNIKRCASASWWPQKPHTEFALISLTFFIYLSLSGPRQRKRERETHAEHDRHHKPPQARQDRISCCCTQNAHRIWKCKLTYFCQPTVCRVFVFAMCCRRSVVNGSRVHFATHIFSGLFFGISAFFGLVIVTDKCKQNQRHFKFFETENHLILEYRTPDQIIF